MGRLRAREVGENTTTVRRVLIMKLDSEFKFGKHKGEQLEDVIEDDPDYVRWLAEEKNFDFDEEVYDALERRARRK